MRFRFLSATGGDLTREELGAFRAAHYAVNGATLIVSGGFEVAAMRDEIARLFGKLPDKAPESSADPDAITPPNGPAWVQVIDDKPRQVTFAIGYAPIQPIDDVATRAASAILYPLPASATVPLTGDPIRVVDGQFLRNDLVLAQW